MQRSTVGDSIQGAFDAILGVVDETLPIERDVESAKDLLLGMGVST
jgi:hypothetical protein